MPEESLQSLQSNIFNALAHPVRLEILEILRNGEACVCHIQAMLDYRQSYISQQLNVLRQAGLVENRKDGLRVYYQTSNPLVYDLIDYAREFLFETGFWSAPFAEVQFPSTSNTGCTCPRCTTGEAENIDLIEVKHD